MNIFLFISTGCVCFILGLIAAWYFTGHKYCLLINNMVKENTKNRVILRLYDVWMMADAKGKAIDQFFLEKEIKTIIIYGMSFLGIRLFKKLENSDHIKVAYALDRNPEIQIPGIRIYMPGEENKENIDAVVVTAVTSFDVIKKELLIRGYDRIYAIDEILYELLIDQEERIT